MRYKCAGTVLVLGLLGLWPAHAVAQATSQIDETVVQQLEGRLETFFRQLAEEQTTVAFQRLLSGNPALLQNAQEIIRRTEQLRQHGSLIVARRLDVRSLGPDVLVFRYLAEHRRLPVVWYVTFYRPPQPDGTAGGQWMVIRLRFDTDVERAAFAPAGS